MPSTFTLQLTYAAQKLNVVVGSLLLIFGTVGSCLNLLVFTHRSLINTPCSTYFIVASLADFVQLINTLLTRILADGFGIDGTLTSNIYCKLRNTIAQIASLTSLTCVTLASFDRYAATSRRPTLRRMNSKTLARYLVVVTTIIWLVCFLPVAIYAKIDNLSDGNTTVCNSSMPQSYVIFQNYFVALVLYGLLPWIASGLFGLITLHNIQQTRRRTMPLGGNAGGGLAQRIDRHLTRIILAQTVVCILSSVPFAVQSMWTTVTVGRSKSADQQAIENFILQVVRLLFYLNYSMNFWICLASSSVFRKKFYDRIHQIRCVYYQNEQRRRQPSVTFTNHPSATTPHVVLY